MLQPWNVTALLPVRATQMSKPHPTEVSRPVILHQSKTVGGDLYPVAVIPPRSIIRFKDYAGHGLRVYVWHTQDGQMHMALEEKV